MPYRFVPDDQGPLQFGTYQYSQTTTNAAAHSTTGSQTCLPDAQRTHP